MLSEGQNKRVTKAAQTFVALLNADGARALGPETTAADLEWLDALDDVMANPDPRDGARAFAIYERVFREHGLEG